MNHKQDWEKWFDTMSKRSPSLIHVSDLAGAGGARSTFWEQMYLMFKARMEAERNPTGDDQ